MRHLDDEGILDLFYERSEQAVTELDRKYGAAVRRTAANILRDRLDVEECLNDTWLAAWNTIPPQRPDPLVSYVCRIARNLAVKRYRADTAAKRNGNYDLVLDERRRSTAFSKRSAVRTASCSCGATSSPIRSRSSPPRRASAPTERPSVFSVSARSCGTICKRRACPYESG